MMHGILDFIGAHPQAALLIVALVALAESLAIVGTLVPAAVVMFGAGALIGNGTLGLWQTLAAAVLGAVLGDGLSYELGRRHEDRIRAWPMFRRNAQAIAKAQDFLRRHGGTSVVLARFAGPVRAFVPLLAGFARMPRLRFYPVNVGSALLWAPAHILPGVLFGSSLQLARAVSGRLAVIALLLVVLVWTVVWSTKLALRFALPRIRRLRDAALARMRGRNVLERLAQALLDPARPGSHALLLGAVLLVAAGWLFLGVLEDVVSRDPLVQADLAVFHFLQELRTGSVDRLMIAITGMGSVGVMLPLLIAVLAWLLWRRCWRTAGYWVGVAAFAEVLVQLLKFTLGRQRPLELYTGVERFSFPSGHAVVSTVVLGFLAFLLSRRRTTRARLAIAATGSVYVALVAFSRLYLGAHWLSDVLGGMGLGLAWVSLAAMVYTQRAVEEDFQPRKLLVAVAVSLVVFGSWWIVTNSAADWGRYAASSTAPPAAPMDDWLDQGWRRLPARRSELAGEPEEPFPLQWACGEAAIRSRLGATDWQPAAPWSLLNALAWLLPQARLLDLPVLPRYDRGSRQQLTFVRWAAATPGEREVLRLWQSEFEVRPEGTAGRMRIWYGAIYREERQSSGHVPLAGWHLSMANAASIAQQLPAGLWRQVRARASGDSPTVLAVCR
jgi:membrane protein DedA with SNARE-associated domain/membrane-associated phospholipid phosphatase